MPLSATGQAIMLGKEAGQSLRTEFTLLDETKAISWKWADVGVDAEASVEIQALGMQYVAYADGQLAEIAYDYFAQADDGGVYYLGEDVSNFEEGQVVNHEGSWLTGVDGAPPGPIMPAQPAIGMVFNPENLPGLVFEQASSRPCSH